MGACAILPRIIALGDVDEEEIAFAQAASGEIADAALRARFEKNIQAFLSLAEAAKNYPCIKRAWVEFLGETPNSEADRVDPVPA